MSSSARSAAAAPSKVLTVIPARLASQRLPGKPLKDIAGKTLVQRVWEQGCKARCISRLIVATDSEEIRQVALGFGAEVMMTSPEITTGSQRVAAVWNELKHEGWDYVMNLQGDMPFIKPELLEQCMSFFESRREQFDMCTVATPILDEATFRSPNDVKVVVSERHQGLYFSRAPIPHSRDGAKLRYVTPGGAEIEVFGFKHFGLYAFRTDALGLFENPDQSPLEQVEKLEQLRLLERGLRIGVCVVPPDLTADSIEVDTPDDLDRSCLIAKKIS
ncbi:MAG: 3-deoxy-manno-octulosonate cytidylyltransferase [Bdellovibrionota bacterium]